jgi:hypothetical protein
MLSRLIAKQGWGSALSQQLTLSACGRSFTDFVLRLQSDLLKGFAVLVQPF